MRAVERRRSIERICSQKMGSRRRRRQKQENRKNKEKGEGK
jgi:hypothetical protein